VPEKVKEVEAVGREGVMGLRKLASIKVCGSASSPKPSSENLLYQISSTGFLAY
jgi:hypothetical protein